MKAWLRGLTMVSRETEQQRRAYYWRQVDHAGSRDAKRALGVLDRVAQQHAVVELYHRHLTAIVLIETLERPLWIRVAEWAARICGRTRTTCGPLQLRGAPFATAKAYRLGALQLDAMAHELKRALTSGDVAAYWHGSAARQTGASISYEEAIEIAAAAVSARPPS